MPFFPPVVEIWRVLYAGTRLGFRPAALCSAATCGAVGAGQHGSAKGSRARRAGCDFPNRALARVPRQSLSAARGCHSSRKPAVPSAVGKFSSLVLATDSELLKHHMGLALGWPVCSLLFPAFPVFSHARFSGSSNMQDSVWLRLIKIHVFHKHERV